MFTNALGKRIVQEFSGPLSCSAAETQLEAHHAMTEAAKIEEQAEQAEKALRSDDKQH